MSTCSLPFFLCDKVIKGFGRGSKSLGIPTANLPVDRYAAMLERLETGVYLGWAQVRRNTAAADGDDDNASDDNSDNDAEGEVFPMAMSIGWNPFFRNEQKTIEIHLIAPPFAADFYGHELRAVVCEYIRAERDFASKEALVDAIHADIALARTRAASHYAALRTHAIFDADTKTVDLHQLNGETKPTPTPTTTTTTEEV